MEFLYITIPITLIIAVLGLVAFFWSTKSGQMDDMEGPKYRMLFDDENDSKK
ncbi:MAG: cbb3-type cytochrome oxidase assembly protein CcoS [Leptospira sp.]|jgi:cbb3-type cytochrome oxidase maturation protein|nr:cbb3-type cytochrome oxidase assembly protein CcoS [Leptospira sp.]NCS93981.1 cbb3-type cytochrome oxidase assembly protein CcoS [Leptospira sp.]